MANGKREQTPDILGDVLAPDESSSTSEAPNAESNQSVSTQQGERSREEVKTAGNSADTEKVEKRKATFYLTEEVLSDLEEGWFRLRQMADAGEKRSVSKSAIVDIALEIVLKELKSNGKESVLADKLLE